MLKKVSVVMATYNGQNFIKDQLVSILQQLNEEDEVIISDNMSSDNTIKEIESLQDGRIKIFYKERKTNNGSINCYFNFENALLHAKGDIVFLSDQDDLWNKDKVAICVKALENKDIVVSDCKVISAEGDIILNSYFERRKSGTGFMKNLITNTYLGCCIAFRRELLTIALPFPKQMPMHDILLGIISELFYQPIFLKTQLVYYREHANNVSPTAVGISRFSFAEQIVFRWKVIKYIPLLFFRKYFR